MSAPTTMRVKKGVTVPMDTDAISPTSLTAAFTMGVETLFDRAERVGDCMDWGTIEVILQHGKDDESLLVVRAAVLR